MKTKDLLLKNLVGLPVSNEKKIVMEIGIQKNLELEVNLKIIKSAFFSRIPSEISSAPKLMEEAGIAIKSKTLTMGSNTHNYSKISYHIDSIIVHKLNKFLFPRLGTSNFNIASLEKSFLNFKKTY